MRRDEADTKDPKKEGIDWLAVGDRFVSVKLQLPEGEVVLGLGCDTGEQ